MNKEILLDTNIIRRLMENNLNVEKSIAQLKSDGFSFRLSDMSLFELVDSIKNEIQYCKLLEVLYDHKIQLIVKDLSPSFEDNYLEWFKKPIAIIEMKKQLLPSFSFTLSTVLTDITKAIMIFIANKLAIDYTSEFYAFVMQAVDSLDKSHFEEVIKNSYLYGGDKLNKRLPLEYRDLVIRLLTYNELLKKQNTFDATTFQIEYEKQDNLYKNKSFKDICFLILSEKDLKFDFSEVGDEMDAKFIFGYFKGFLCKKDGFKINDFTDYINFKYALKYCDGYFTGDIKSLNKYQGYFTDEKILDFIQNTKKLAKKYL